MPSAMILHLVPRDWSTAGSRGRVLKSYHRSLNKDSPVSRVVSSHGSHQIPSGPWRIAPPILPNLSFRYTQGAILGSEFDPSITSQCSPAHSPTSHARRRADFCIDKRFMSFHTGTRTKISACNVTRDQNRSAMGSIRGDRSSDDYQLILGVKSAVLGFRQR
jgi:hypothetical protein